MKRIIKVAVVISAIAIALMGFAACGVDEVNAVTKDQAIQTALNEVDGAGISDVTHAEKTVSDGKLIYDIDIIYDGYEYEFEISAEDARILDSNYEKLELEAVADAQVATDWQSVAAENPEVKPASNSGSASASVKTFSLSDAKARAVAEVPGASMANVVSAEEDYDDGIREYEVEIHCGGFEYEFTFNAGTGDIIEKSVEKID